jgi:hypothetical protein
MAVHALADRPPAEREEWLRSTTGITGGELTSHDLSGVERPGAELLLSAEWHVPRLATRAGTRLLIAPHVLAPPPAIPRALTRRTQPVHLGPASIESDTVRITLPEGYVVEARPADVTIETPFGRYARSTFVQSEARTLVFQRRLEVLQTRLPPEAYEEVRAFFAGVARADAERVALVRATDPITPDTPPR